MTKKNEKAWPAKGYICKCCGDPVHPSTSKFAKQTQGNPEKQICFSCKMPIHQQAPRKRISEARRMAIVDKMANLPAEVENAFHEGRMVDAEKLLKNEK